MNSKFCSTVLEEIPKITLNIYDVLNLQIFTNFNVNY
jgi:hypothetical protein